MASEELSDEAREAQSERDRQKFRDFVLDDLRDELLDELEVCVEGLRHHGKRKREDGSFPRPRAMARAGRLAQMLRRRLSVLAEVRELAAENSGFAYKCMRCGARETCGEITGDLDDFDKFTCFACIGADLSSARDEIEDQKQRIATLERDLAAAREKLAEAWDEGARASSAVYPHQRVFDGNPYRSRPGTDKDGG